MCRLARYWDAGTRKMTWTIPEIEPGGGSKTYSFRVRLGGLGIFKVDGEAIGRGGLRDFKSVSTSVEGNADVELNVTADMRFLDVGQDNVFRITLRNLGTKEARKVQVSALLSDTLEAVETGGTDQNAIVDTTKKVQIAFPEIDRIPPGAEKVLGIKARAKAPGLGTCRVYVSHDDLKDFGGARLEKVAYSKITGTVGCGADRAAEVGGLDVVFAAVKRNDEIPRPGTGVRISLFWLSYRAE